MAWLCKLFCNIQEVWLVSCSFKQEALCEMNDELQETSRETELELRDMLDQSHMKLNEANRKVEALNETILDYQSTIVKFRELVLQLQVILMSWNLL